MTKDFITPSTLPGFMELLPREQLAFNKILDTIRGSYELYGFVPLDTPVIEKAEILNAKGGEETEKQLYAFKKAIMNWLYVLI
jgi:histidyl-tRNA synthetase